MIFVIASYASFIRLFCFLRLFESAPTGSLASECAKIGSVSDSGHGNRYVVSRPPVGFPCARRIAM
jgi:hypothetical protein